MADKELRSCFSERLTGDRIVCHGPQSGQICLRITPGRLFITVKGEPTGETLTSCFREALERDPEKINVPSLIDLTRFQGTVDWKAIMAVRDMANWGIESRPLKTAYLMRQDTMLEKIVKVLTALFENSQHRSFDNYDEALAWLDVA